MPAFEQQGDSANELTDVEAVVAVVIAELSSELNWGLTTTVQRTYAHTLVRYLPDNCASEYIRQVALRYHQDHALVEALLDPLQLRHESGWKAWTEQVVPILRHAGLAWSDDVAIDLEDLAQIARAELARALPSFHYGSRFSTWAHQVIARSVQRYIRDRQAAKRAGRPASLDALVADALPADETVRPEPIAGARVLRALIDRILRAQPDQRLAVIFQLWAIADVRVEEIGQHVQLSPSQVRALLVRIRHVLQNDPAIRAWREEDAVFCSSQD